MRSLSNEVAIAAAAGNRRRWWTLAVVALGLLMSAMTATTVNVALPSIGRDLQFSGSSLAWVVNAYLCTFGGFLLIAGRLGDIFSQRRLFLLGVMLFTLASLGCALATSRGFFVASRAAQGSASAIVSATTLSLVMTLFTETPLRARALGVCTFVGASASSLGMVLGGAVTSMASWRWMFFGNVLVGAGIVALCFAVLPRGRTMVTRGRLDVAGAGTATTSLVIASFAIVNGNLSGWSSPRTLGWLAVAGSLMVVFVCIEGRTRAPLMPKGLFRLRNVAVANAAGALWAAAMLGWSFFSTQYLQLILELSPLQVGCAFLPATLIAAVTSLGVSPMLVARFGTTRPLVAGLLIGSAGLALLARAPADASVVFDVLPGMVLVGLGSGMVYSPLVLSALTCVSARDYGAASGTINASFTLGGALGLSALASIAAARTDHLLALGTGLPFALSSAYRVAFSVSAALAALAALVIVLFLRAEQHPCSRHRVSGHLRSFQREGCSSNQATIRAGVIDRCRQSAKAVPLLRISHKRFRGRCAAYR